MLKTVKVPLEELARKSYTILQGTVSDKWSEYEEDEKNIITFIKIDASRSIKGKAIASDTLVIPGGIVGDVGMVVSHTPQFSIGEEVVVFISDDYKGRPTITGWKQGKFPVIRDRIFYENKEIQAVEFVRELERFIQRGEQGSIEMDTPDEQQKKQQQPDGSSINMLFSGPSISSISPNSGPALRPYAIDPNDPFDPGERGFVIDIYGSALLRIIH